MRRLGIALLLAGVLMAIVALLLPTSVSVEGTQYLSGIQQSIGTGQFSSVYNLPRAQTQSLVFAGGCTLFLGGCMLFGAGSIVERLVPVAAVSLSGGDAQAEPMVGELPAHDVGPMASRAEGHDNEGAYIAGASVFLIVLCTIAYFTMGRL